jgi:hypothetical protein
MDINAAFGRVAVIFKFKPMEMLVVNFDGTLGVFRDGTER